MESQGRKLRKRREREEIGGQVLADNLIGSRPKERRQCITGCSRTSNRESRYRRLRCEDGRVFRRAGTARQTSSGDCPDTQRGHVAADRDAVPRVRRRILLPRSPAVGSPVEISSDDNTCPRKESVGTGSSVAYGGGAGDARADKTRVPGCAALPAGVQRRPPTPSAVSAD